MIPPGWHPPQPGGRDTVAPLKSQNWVHRKNLLSFSLSLLFPNTHSYVSGDFTISPHFVYGVTGQSQVHLIHSNSQSANYLFLDYYTYLQYRSVVSSSNTISSFLFILHEELMTVHKIYKRKVFTHLTEWYSICLFAHNKMNISTMANSMYVKFHFISSLFFGFLIFNRALIYYFQ